jgi:tripartite-type tricarboxylate transporter receptor subunit TctC
MGQKFVVENRLGAGGNIGSAAVARSAPDGYTLVLGTLGTHVFNPVMYAALDFDPEKDFEPIVLVAKLPFLICVTPSFPAASIPELIAAVKSRPDSVNVAITSTTSRVVYEFFKKSAGISLFMVPYAGQGPAIIDVMEGRVPVIMEPVTSLLPHVSSGKLKALAITTRNSSALMPGLKSVAEQGMPEFGEYVGWTALFGPKGVPRDVVNLLNSEFNKLLSQPETRKRLLELGSEAGSGSPQELAAYVAAERERWSPIIRAANIKAQ